MPPAMQAEPEQQSFSFIEEVERGKEIDERRKREDDHRQSWEICWGWEGPKPGGFCEVGEPIVRLAEPVDGEHGRCENLYCYCERCRLIEERSDGTWLAEIDEPDADGRAWPKNGTRLILDITEIWPPVRDLMAERDKQEANDLVSTAGGPPSGDGPQPSESEEHDESTMR